MYTHLADIHGEALFMLLKNLIFVVFDRNESSNKYML